MCLLSGLNKEKLLKFECPALRALMPQIICLSTVKLNIDIFQVGFVLSIDDLDNLLNIYTLGKDLFTIRIFASKIESLMFLHYYQQLEYLHITSSPLELSKTNNFQNLKSLQTLSLYYNGFSHFKFEWISNNKNLRTLLFSSGLRRNFTGFDYANFECFLEDVRIVETPLTEFPIQLLKVCNSTLKSLGLQEEYIDSTPNDIRSIAPKLAYYNIDNIGNLFLPSKEEYFECNESLLWNL